VLLGIRGVLHVSAKLIGTGAGIPREKALVPPLPNDTRESRQRDGPARREIPGGANVVA